MRHGRLGVGVQTWAGFQFLTLADRRSWYADQPLELVRFESSDATVAALRAGVIDAATLTLDEAIRLRAQGVDVQVVLVCDVSAGADVVLARPGIDTLADLRGRRLGVETTTLGVLMLAETLRAAGLEAADVTVVHIEEDHYKAWHRGGLDAVLSYGASAERLQQEGLALLADSRSFRQMIVDVLAVRRDRGLAYRSELRALVAGHFRALELWRQNPIDAAYELGPLLDTRPEDVRSVFKGIDLPDLAANHRWLDAPATEMTNTAQRVADVLTATGSLERAPSLDGLFTAHYLPKART
jgi:NitT/TauT family transport system substrate-binding protein